MKKLHDGVYEVNEAGLLPMTQAIKESKESVTMRVLDEVREVRITPIEEACTKCDFWQDKFATTKECQERQAKDARARGFMQVICAEQFVDA